MNSLWKSISCIGLGSGILLTRRPMRCEALSAGSSPLSSPLNTVGSRGSKIDAHELSIGSFTGLITGYLAGKISRSFVFVIGGAFLLLQFLSSRNIIHVPWNQLRNLLRNRVNMDAFQSKLLTNPSFKAAFGSTFVIGALYS